MLAVGRRRLIGEPSPEEFWRHPEKGKAQEDSQHKHLLENVLKEKTQLEAEKDQ